MHQHCVNQFDWCNKKPINSVLNRYFFVLFPFHLINKTILSEIDHVFPLSFTKDGNNVCAIFILV